ncbi:NACHT domain-containing protein [Rhizobium lentis]|uniref:NACHT domain-containing protein n=1 Tax=Rhizobium lentis TaxID=1138194 RepID=A0A7W8XED0_9HYPH|nr:hypothetical protein [Rhizobium lentis]MBB4573131.1 hypothetical protein [Rhizobium lentis]MBB5549060.1 hypothetical protein [Rhizobium lentis]MBB5559593.1 hypothetical protein [Rhizobium lentis]MBB5566523.1 hypothetical protein [Rhizobium lentis]
MPVGTDIIVGVLSSIVYDGLKRPFKGITEITGRRRAINRALSNPSTADLPDKSEANRAVNDVIRVLGNDHGEFTDNVANFLQDVERSVIPDALKHFAFCGHTPDDAFPAFELLYKTHEPLPFACEALFKALDASIKIRIDQSIEEKVLFEALKTQHEDLATRITALSSCLRNAASIQEPISSERFEELREKIARGIEAANRQINVETTQGTRKVNVKKLVIAARLQPLSDKGQIPAPHREAPPNETPSYAYLNFRRSFNRAVILGDPGGGKSTLTQLVCFDLARQITLAAANPKYSGFDSRDMKLPLRIILRTFEKRQQQNPSYQIFDYLIDEIRVYCDNDEFTAKKLLQQLLIFGQAVLLFDGLDEVLDVGARRSMASQIEQFTSAYATCPALVTSRIVGYGDAPVGDDYQLFTLARFNIDEVRKFTEQLLKAISNEKADIAKEKAVDFLAQTEATARDLRENPLLLGLMVYIFNSRGEVPNSRPEIYKECSVLMFEKWDQRRDIKFEFPNDFDLLDLFGYLASQIFGSADTEDGVDEEWLLDRLKAYFNIWYQDKARSFAAAKVLVNFITGRAWVMCEIGPGVFKFTHRTFLEYFFAKRIEEEAGSVTGLIRGNLLDKIIKSQWDVVNHLALQIATFRSGPKSTQAIETLLKIGTEEHFAPSEEANFLTFFGRALDYLLVPETRLIQAIDHIFRRCIQLGGNFSLTVGSIVSEVLSATQKRGMISQEVMRDIAGPLLAGPGSAERTYLLYILGMRFSGHRIYRRNVFYTDLVWQSFRQIRQDWQAEQFNRAVDNAAEARTYYYVYGDKFRELFSIHGVALLFSVSSELIPFEVSHLGYLIIHEAVRLQSKIGGPRFHDLELSQADARFALTTLSDLMYDRWQQGTIDEVIPASAENIKFPVLDEFAHYISYISGRRMPASLRTTISRAAFLYIVLADGHRNREHFERVFRSRRTKKTQNVQFASLPELFDDKFSRAIAQIRSGLAGPLFEAPASG